MSEAVEKNYSDPRSYHILAKLLHAPAQLEANELVVASFRKAVDAAMQLPEGAAREAVLTGLTSGLNAACRRIALYAENGRLKEQLKLTRPEFSELNGVAYQMCNQFKLLQRKVSECVAGERKNGTDIGKSYWPWLDHELAVSAHFVDYTFRKFEASINALQSAPVAPPSKPERPQA